MDTAEPDVLSDLLRTDALVAVPCAARLLGIPADRLRNILARDKIDDPIGCLALDSVVGSSCARLAELLERTPDGDDDGK